MQTLFWSVYGRMLDKLNMTALIDDEVYRSKVNVTVNFNANPYLIRNGDPLSIAR